MTDTKHITPVTPQTAAKAIIWVSDADDMMSRKIDDNLAILFKGLEGDRPTLEADPGTMASYTLRVGYTSKAEAAQAIAKLNDALAIVLGRLGEHGLQHVDIDTWKPDVIVVIDRDTDEVRAYPVVTYSIDVTLGDLYPAFMGEDSLVFSEMVAALDTADKIRRNVERAWKAHRQVIETESGQPPA